MIKVILKYIFKGEMFKMLRKVNSLEELKTKRRDLFKFYYKSVELDLNNLVLPQEPTYQDDCWQNLKNTIQNMTMFEFLDSVYPFFDISQYFFRLDGYYVKDNKPYIRMLADVYTEEAIVYVVDSCVNGMIEGKFKVIPISQLDNPEYWQDRFKNTYNEVSLQDWKNNIYDMVMHDFKTDYKYEVIAMEGLIKALQDKSFKDRISTAIDYLKYNQDVLKYTELRSKQDLKGIEVSLFHEYHSDFEDITKEPYSKLIKYKNIPISRMFISSLSYSIGIFEDRLSVDRRKEIIVYRKY